jgi:hypothetical protein
MRYLFTYVLIGFCLPSIAQFPIDSSFRKYVNTAPQEKIHLHLDRNSYTAGETIFFKAYLWSAGSPAFISSNLYVDIYNDSGKLVKHTIWPIMAASARGNVDIPANYAFDRLHIKAYTQWMLNAGTDFLYQQSLPIVTSKSSTIPIAATNDITLQFFPEGGHWVYNLPANLAFKATFSNGLPATVQGNIENQQGDSITNFSTWHNGMGTVVFTPEKAATYVAVFSTSDGKKIKTELPKPLTTGASIKVYQSDTAVGYTIYTSKAATNNLNTIHVVAHINEQIVYKANVSLTHQQIINNHWNITDLPTGIMQITFLDADWKPFAERIVFINNENYAFNAWVNTDTINTKPRGYNSIEVEVPVSYSANMSLSVTDADADEPFVKNIYTSLLLQGDLRGYIHNAAAYFSDTSTQAKAKLDLVMLTNGWRQYNWQQLVNNIPPSRPYPAEQAYITLSGKVDGFSKKQQQKIQQLFLFAVGKDSSRNMFMVPLEETGNFSLSGLVFFDTVQVYLRYNNKINNNYFDYTLNSSMQLQADSMLVLPLQRQRMGDTVIQTLAQYIAEQQMLANQTSKWNDLGTLELKKTPKKSRIEELDEQYTSSLFRAFDAYSLDVANDINAIGANSVFFYLKARVGGIKLGSDPDGNPLVTWRNGRTAIYLNEVRTEPATLEGITMNDVAYIKLFPPPFMGAQYGGNGGAIVVYTKRGGENFPPTSPGMKQKTVFGYSTIKQFYSPDYATTNSIEKDLRTTLYWNPAVLTNSENRKLKLHFYNNDITRRFYIVLEGMNEDGKLIRVEKLVE